MQTLDRLEWDAPDERIRRSRLSNHILIVGASILMGLLTDWPSSHGGDVVSTFTYRSSVSISPDDRMLTFRFLGPAPYEAGDPCTADYAVLVNEADDEVRVRLYERRPWRSGTTLCLAMGFERAVVALLDDPLRGRPVVVIDVGEIPVTREQSA